MLKVAANSYDVVMSSTKKNEPVTTHPLAVQWSDRHGADLTDVEGFPISKENGNLSSTKYRTVTERNQASLDEARLISDYTNDIHEMHGEQMSDRASSRKKQAEQSLKDKGYDI